MAGTAMAVPVFQEKNGIAWILTYPAYRCGLSEWFAVAWEV